MELDVPHQAVVETYCELQRTSILNMRPPVITRVCRESREVAFQNAGIVKDGSDPNAPPWFSETSLRQRWFSPATDTVHLNWAPAYGPSFDHVGEPIPFFLWEAAKGIAASLTADLLYPFDDPSRRGWITSDYDMLARRKDYLVTLMMVNLHVSIDQAAGSGLFGRLAEERVKLVDPADEETIQKYHQLWLLGPQQDQEPATFFELALSTKDFKDRVKKWRNDVDQQWLWHKWTQAKDEAENLANIKESEPIWLIPPGQEDEYEDEGLLPDYPNMDHPWVKKMLEGVPQFFPMIMFRLCEEKCYIQRRFHNTWSR
jgi:hypothetical protein